MLIAPPSVFRPKRTEGPRITSTRSTSSSGIRSKFTSSTVGSLRRTPSRKTLSPGGRPVTGEIVNPRSERSGWSRFPCSLWSETPGSRSRASGNTAGASRRISGPVSVSTRLGADDGMTRISGRRGGASRSGAEAGRKAKRTGARPHSTRARMRMRAILAPRRGPSGPPDQLARQARRLGADPLDLVDGLRRARGEHLRAVGGDQHVVLDADADSQELLRDRVDDLRGLRLLLLLEPLRGRQAEAESALPHLVLAVLAEVEGRRLPRGVDVEAGLDREHHAGLDREHHAG